MSKNEQFVSIWYLERSPAGVRYVVGTVSANEIDSWKKNPASRAREYIIKREY